MRKLILSALIPFVFPLVGMSAVEGQWTYYIENGGATIVASTATGNVTIPSVLGGYTVFKVGYGNFATGFGNLSAVFGNPNTSVTSVVIPNSVTNIANYAFINCTALTSVTIGNSVTNIGTSAFQGCTSLITVTIPNKVTSIGDYAFNGCSNLASTTIGASVTSIPTGAFNGCISLTAITIPNWVTNIASGAFTECKSLTSIAIPNSVTSIGDYVFYDCWSVRDITIGSGLASIGNDSFYSCRNLTSISVDSSNPNYSSDNGILFNKLKTILIKCPDAKLGSYAIPNSVISIGDKAFYYCNTLTSVTIPDSVISIGYRAFYNFPSLTNVSIGNNVANIGDDAFNGCAGLTTVTIGNNVTSLGNHAFRNCTSLAVATIGSGVTTIGYYAFSGCTALTKATIGNGVKNILSMAFANCTALTRIEFLGSAPSYDVTSFQYSFPIVYYGAGTTGWGTYYAGLSTAVLVSNILTTICNSNEGTLLKNPNQSSYQSDETVTISATPKAGYLFNTWSGASTATTSSITLTMNSNKTVTANFTQDGGDADGDGLTNYQESVTYGTNPNHKDTNSDGIEDGQAVTLGYSPTFNFSALISHLQSHPPTGLYTASQMQAMAIGDLVLTKNTNGSFTLNYDIEQSSDLQSWLPYQSFNLPLTNLPPDKAFIRFRAKQ